MLRALVAVRRGAQTTPVSLETVELQDRVPRRDTEATVGAMNTLLGKLADQIARTLAAAPR